MNDSVEIFIEDRTELRTYVVKAKLASNGLNGECKNIYDNTKVVFSGYHSATEMQQLSSPMVVPLYEFKDQDGTYFYSIKSELKGLQRSEKPICRVWKNPSSVFALDFNAKPVPLKR